MSSKNKIKEKILPDYQLSDAQLWILTAAIAGVYFAYSFFSNGFYQHDEIAHYLNMLDFWKDPKVILGNWAKPGFKIIFVVFALGGSQALLIVNSIVAALACYVTYKVTVQIGTGSPLMAFFLLALQPMWLQISFRNYSETISALLLVTALFFHYRNKPAIVSLLLSYGTSIRQEFIVIAGIYGIYLLSRREWRAFAPLFIFPILINIAGYLSTGDILYLYTSTVKTGASYESSYPKMGFDHYFLMAPTIYGLLSLSALVLYFSMILKKAMKPLYILLVPALAYFFLHCLFNTQSLSVGASTGGNLRYLIVVAPIFSILGSIALTNFLKVKNRFQFLYFFIPFILAVGIWTTYQHNYVVLLPDVRDFKPLWLAMASAIGFFFIRTQREMVKFVVIGSIVFAFIMVRPIMISTEDAQIKRAVQWAKEQNLEREHILVNHVVFFFFYGKSANLFDHGAESIDSLTVANAPIGSYIIWDSHYSYRPEWNPKALPYDYFAAKPKQFVPLRTFVTPDGRFGMIVFQKAAQ